MLTKAEIQAMLARAEAATPGPLTSRHAGKANIKEHDIAVPAHVVRLDLTPAGERRTTFIADFYQSNADADFFAAARADVPRLARELLALLEEGSNADRS